MSSTWYLRTTGKEFNSSFQQTFVEQEPVTNPLRTSAWEAIPHGNDHMLQRVQFAAASFVLGHYVKNFRDVLKIGWLPINERRDLNLLKWCFKALHNAETWPDYLKIIKQECPKELRSSNSIRLVVPTENGTFQDNASKLFNNLPETIRNCKDYRTFLRLSRNFLRNRVQSD